MSRLGRFKRWIRERPSLMRNFFFPYALYTAVLVGLIYLTQWVML